MSISDDPTFKHSIAPLEKTRAEIDNLIADWRSDPTWDLEDSPGFEAHRDELTAIREKIGAELDARRAKEHERALAAIMRPAFDSLPEKDEQGGLTRAEAASPTHATYRLMRAVAEMLLPVVERLNQFEQKNDDIHRGLADDIIKLYAGR